jgi:ribosomal-protein-alanine N-acetyltransferase
VISAAPKLRLEEQTTAIRPFVRSDLDALLALRLANQRFLLPYEPDRDPSFFTRAGQAREITLDQEAWAHGTSYAFAICVVDGETERLAGRVALSNVVRGPWQNATLGYWVDEHANGQGHCTRAVGLVCRFAFDHAGLHRVQPAIMPRNARSRRVAEKAGFRLEGTAKRYLRIAGVWEDHDIFAMTGEDWASLA